MIIINMAISKLFIEIMIKYIITNHLLFYFTGL